MATAEVKIEKVPVVTYKETQKIVLTLARSEAAALRCILGSIAGGGKNSIREIVSPIYYLLGDSLKEDFVPVSLQQKAIVEQSMSVKEGGRELFDKYDR